MVWIRIATVPLWIVTLCAQNGWFASHKTFFAPGYKIGLWLIEYEPPDCRQPLQWLIIGGCVCLAAVLPILAVNAAIGSIIAWALSWTGIATIGCGAIAFGLTAVFAAPVALAVLVQAVTLASAALTAVAGVTVMFYSWLFQTGAPWWQKFVEAHVMMAGGAYTWSEAREWRKWRRFENASIFMVTVIVLNIGATLFQHYFIHENYVGELGCLLLARSVFTIWALVNYFLGAREAVGGGHVDVMFCTAVLACFLTAVRTGCVCWAFL